MAGWKTKLIAKIEKALHTELEDFQSGLLRNMPGERVLGYVVSSDFSGKQHSARQRRLDAILKQALTEEELLRLGPIATLTPQEADIGRKAG